MKFAISTALALILGTTAMADTAQIGTMTVTGTADEIAVAELAYNDVHAWFLSRGFEQTPTVTVTFLDPVMVPTNQGDVRVSGYFNVVTNEIFMTSMVSEWGEQRAPLGLGWESTMFRSIVSHELTHAWVGAVMQETYGDLPKVWHEFIAYSVQGDVMADADREQAIVNLGISEKDYLTGYLQVNPMVYGADPDRFSLVAWQYHSVNPGMIEGLLTGTTEFNPKDIDTMFDAGF